MHPVTADLATDGGVTTLTRAGRPIGQPVDVLANNAGIQNTLDLSRPVDPAVIDPEIAVNLAGPIKLTLALMPALRAPGATIVNVTSLVSRHPKLSAPVYSATKAGLASYTQALRVQLAVHVEKPNGAAVPVRPHLMEYAPGKSLVRGGGPAAIFRGVHRFDPEPLSSGCTRLHHTEVFSRLFVSSPNSTRLNLGTFW